DVNESGWDCSLEEGRHPEGRHKGTKAQRHKGEEAQRSCDMCKADSPWRNDEYPSRASDCASLPSVPLCLCASVPSSSPALRLGMRLTKGLGETEGRAIEAAVRARGPFKSVEALWRASGVSVKALRALAQADAFRSM